MGSIPTSTHHEDVKDLIVARSASNVYALAKPRGAFNNVFETWDDDMNDHDPFTSAEKLTCCRW